MKNTDMTKIKEKSRKTRIKGMAKGKSTHREGREDKDSGYIPLGKSDNKYSDLLKG